MDSAYSRNGLRRAALAAEPPSQSGTFVAPSKPKQNLRFALGCAGHLSRVAIVAFLCWCETADMGYYLRVPAWMRFMYRNFCRRLEVSTAEESGQLRSWR